MNNHIYKPYTYLIGWSDHNKYYYGVRYAKDCHPSDLWSSYFTSSKYVQEFREEYGEPDIVQVRKTFDNKDSAYDWEQKVLLKMKVDERPDFLNKCVSWFGPVSEETRRKLSEIGKGRIFSEEHKEKIGKAHKGKILSEETKKKIGESHVGNQYRLGIAHTEKSKKQMSEAHKGKILSEETKKKIGNAQRGKTVSEETRKKLSEALKDRVMPEETKRKLREAYDRRRNKST